MEISQQTIDRDELAKYLAQTLDITRFRDFCPNGLQVEGKSSIGTLVTGVTASIALIDAAIAHGADAILVHHGYFWRGEDARVIGQKQRRLKRLLTHDINLFAYHLPLDMHPEIGNNAQLAKYLDLLPDGHFGEDNLGWLGRAAEPDLHTVEDLVKKIESCLGRTPLVVGDVGQALGRIGWCTGAAQNLLGDAINAGATVYLSGEISEQTVHLARESGVCYIACGHHATERYGVQALGKLLAHEFRIKHVFVDVPNPV